MTLKEDFQRAIAQSQQGKSVSNLPSRHTYDHLDPENLSNDDIKEICQAFIGKRIAMMRGGVKLNTEKNRITSCQYVEGIAPYLCFNYSKNAPTSKSFTIGVNDCVELLIKGVVSWNVGQDRYEIVA